MGKHQQRRPGPGSTGRYGRVRSGWRRIWPVAKIFTQIAIAQLAAWALRRWGGT